MWPGTSVSVPRRFLPGRTAAGRQVGVTTAVDQAHDYGGALHCGLQLALGGDPAGLTGTAVWSGQALRRLFRPTLLIP
jgi:hypothetical protein